MKESVNIQGHRGCRGLMPENTIPAFFTALDLGVSTLELDVVVSADHRLIISHEPFMNADICSFPDGGRFSGEEGEMMNIYRMTSDSAAKFDCGKLGHPRFPDQLKIEAHKPLLSELCDTLRSYCQEKGIAFPFLNIELKSRPEWYGNYQPEPELYAEIALREIKAAGLENRFSLQSFDFAMLRALHEAFPAASLICLNEDRSKSMEDCFSELGFVPRVYSPYYELADELLVLRCREANVALSVWTVNDTAEAARLLEAGVRDIITDYPDRMLKLITEKGFEVLRH